MDAFPDFSLLDDTLDFFPGGDPCDVDGGAPFLCVDDDDVAWSKGCTAAVVSAPDPRLLVRPCVSVAAMPVWLMAWDFAHGRARWHC